MTDDIDDQYRKASAAASGVPAETTRQRILAQAALLAAQRARQRSRSRWRRPALYGSLAAATLAGLMVVPQFLRHDPSPQVARNEPVNRTASPAVRQFAPPPPEPATGEAGAPAADTPAADFPAPRAALTALPSRRQPAPQAAAATAHTDAERADAGRADAGAVPAAMARSVAAAPAPPALPAAINARDAAGRTALLNAVLRGDADAVAALLASGANPDIADADGLSPLQAAIEGHQPAIAAALRQAGAH